MKRPRRRPRPKEWCRVRSAAVAKCRSRPMPHGAAMSLHLRGCVSTLDARRVLRAEGTAKRARRGRRHRSSDGASPPTSKRRAPWRSCASWSTAGGARIPPAAAEAGQLMTSVHRTTVVVTRPLGQFGEPAVATHRGRVRRARVSTHRYRAGRRCCAAARRASTNCTHPIRTLTRWWCSCRRMHVEHACRALASAWPANVPIGVLGPGSVAALARQGISAPAYTVISPPATIRKRPLRLGSALRRDRRAFRYGWPEGQAAC